MIPITSQSPQLFLNIKHCSLEHACPAIFHTLYFKGGLYLPLIQDQIALVLETNYMVLFLLLCTVKLFKYQNWSTVQTYPIANKANHPSTVAIVLFSFLLLKIRLLKWVYFLNWQSHFNSLHIASNPGHALQTAR